jgi:HJR/Mrr/RecB family endonuclease
MSSVTAPGGGLEKFDDIVNKIIPFFKKHPIQGVKAKNFKDFCKVVVLMKEKKHLTTGRRI